MRRTHALTVLTAVALGGCTQTVTVSRAGPAPRHLTATEAPATDEIEVRMRTGTLSPVYKVVMSGDSLIAWHPGGRGTSTVPMRDVLQIETGKDHRGGALKGLRIGALIGAGVGLLSSLDPEQQCYASPCPGSSGFIVQSAVGGAIWGLTVGAIRGNKIRYVITP